MSSLLGLALLVAAIFTVRQSLPVPGQLGTAPLSAWLGGVFGAVYAIVTVVLARHIGAATLVALVVSGQLVCSVLLDHFGMIGFDVRPATLARLLGCGMMRVGCT